MYRQGDVLLVPMPRRRFKRARQRQPENGRVVLAYGEVTGHAHVMEADCVRLYDAYDEENRLEEVLIVEQTSLLTHNDHLPIRIPRGLYRVVHQREYSPRAFAGAVSVAD